jgi:hypothetical protein
MEFTESTSNPRSPVPSNESWCLLCCKCKKNCSTCFLTKQLQKICTGHSRTILSRVNRRRQYGRFQQDSAIAHVCLCRLCPMSYRISSSGIWPACSPYLNHHNFFFWACLKDKVYNFKPRTEKPNCMETANIPAEQVQRVNQNFCCWCEECLHVKGAAFSTPPVICEL